MRTPILGLLVLNSLGCGGGVPLLHEARTLALGDVRVAGGLSANVPIGSTASAITAARNDAAINPNPAPGTDATLAKGALALAAVTPGIAPVIAARVGVGARVEGGLTYTGRAARIDLRRSFDYGQTSLSVGVGITAVFYDSHVTSEQAQLASVDLSSLHGYGADVPLLLGWRSRGGVYMAWGGLRAGWEHDQISTLTSEPVPMLPGEPPGLSATRLYGGAVAGVAAGFRHIHAALEIDVSYQSISGAFEANQVTVSGLSAAPAGALWWTF
jgi:hypothetical protein